MGNNFHSNLMYIYIYHGRKSNYSYDIFFSVFLVFFFLLAMKSRTYSKLQHTAVPIRHITELSLTQWAVSASLSCVFLLISCVKSRTLFQQKWLGPHFTTDLGMLVNTGPRGLPLMFFSSPQCLLLEKGLKTMVSGSRMQSPRMVCVLLSINKSRHENLVRTCQHCLCKLLQSVITNFQKYTC